MSEKLTNEYSILIKGGMKEKENEKTKMLEIEYEGDTIDLRSGLIHAMKTSKEVAKLIIDAADYFKENGKNFEYNKK
jgi:hypothetical protein